MIKKTIFPLLNLKTNFASQDFELFLRYKVSTLHVGSVNVRFTINNYKLFISWCENDKKMINYIKLLH